MLVLVVAARVFLRSSGFRPSTRTNILNSNGNIGKKSHLVKFLLHIIIIIIIIIINKEVYKMLLNSSSIIPFLNKRLHFILLSLVSVKCT